MSARARRGMPVTVAFVVASSLVTPTARATTCGRPVLLDTVPPDMATGVPQNASFFAHYDPNAEYENENVLFTPDGGAGEGFAGNDPMPAVVWDGTQGLLSFTPPAPLAPGGYTIVWPALRGLNTASPSLPATVHVTVGALSDVTPPDFAGVTRVTWDLERQTNDCTNALEDRFVFTLSLAPATDDGGLAGLTLVVFQSSGSGVDGGSVPVLTTPMPTGGAPVTVALSVGEATGHVCFAAIARDLTGKISSSGSQTVCVDTTAPPFFRGCAIAPGGRGGDTAPIVVALLMVVAGRRRRAPGVSGAT